MRWSSGSTRKQFLPRTVFSDKAFSRIVPHRARFSLLSSLCASLVFLAGISFFLRPILFSTKASQRYPLPTSKQDISSLLLTREGNHDLEVSPRNGLKHGSLQWAGAWSKGREKASLEEDDNTACSSKGNLFNVKQKGFTRRKVLAVVGLQTAFENKMRRDALRATWLGSSPADLSRLEASTGLVVRFILGRSKDQSKEMDARLEMKKFNDILRLDIYEEYLKLNRKTLAYFKSIFELFDADYYVKADDDIYLRPDRLGYLLAKDRESSRVYIGCMKKGPVVRDPHFKWFEPDAHVLGAEYFLHAYGPIYVLSKDVVESLHGAKEGSLRMFMNEDVTVGSWMLAFNVTYEDNRFLCEATCGPKSIAVWDIPTCSGLCDAPKKLVALHNTKECSKSSTLSD